MADEKKSNSKSRYYARIEREGAAGLERRRKKRIARHKARGFSLHEHWEKKAHPRRSERPVEHVVFSQPVRENLAGLPLYLVYAADVLISVTPHHSQAEAHAQTIAPGLAMSYGVLSPRGVFSPIASRPFRAVARA